MERFWAEAHAQIENPHPELAVAVTRMTMMRREPRRSDRVLDLMIVMESLFLLDEERMELSYRLSIRAAHFLGRSFRQRTEIANLLKRAYGLRSKIAHGEEIEGAEEVVSNLDQLVRRTVVDYLSVAANRPEKKLVKRMCNEMIRTFSNARRSH